MGNSLISNIQSVVSNGEYAEVWNIILLHDKIINIENLIIVKIIKTLCWAHCI